MSGFSGVISGARTTSTPVIVTSAGTALAANPNRAGLIIQNLDTDPLFVRFGDTASSTVFNLVLAGGTGADDGTGGYITFTSGVIPTGLVSIAGTTPRAMITELIE